MYLKTINRCFLNVPVINKDFYDDVFHVDIYLDTGLHLLVEFYVKITTYYAKKEDIYLYQAKNNYIFNN